MWDAIPAYGSMKNSKQQSDHSPLIIHFIFIFREKRLGIKTELQIRKKAMQVDGFPSQEVIDEFLQQPIELSSLQLEWGQPNLVKFLVKTNIKFYCIFPKMSIIFLFIENDEFVVAMGRNLLFSKVFAVINALAIVSLWQRI